MTSWPVPPDAEVAEVNGYPMAYRAAGHGSPLVLIHGSFNDYRTWDAQIDALRFHCRVIAPSLRHYYPERWDRHGNDFTILQHADDLAAFIRALGLDAACVLGHSRGGAVALTLARRHGGLLGRLVLADPRGLEGLLPSTSEGEASGRELRILFSQLEQNLRAGDLQRAARCFVDGLAGEGAWDRRPPELQQMFFDNLATAIDTGEAPPLACADVRALAMPVLLLSGERSPRRYGEMLRAFAACARDVETVVIAGAGHAMHRDNPQAFTSAVLAFMRSQRRDRRG